MTKVSHLSEVRLNRHFLGVADNSAGKLEHHLLEASLKLSGTSKKEKSYFWTVTGQTTKNDGQRVKLETHGVADKKF